MITEFIIKWIAGVMALAIFFLPVAVPVVLILWLTKRKKSEGRKGECGSGARGGSHSPEWEKVLLEDGTEFWRLKGSALPQDSVNSSDKKRENLPYRKKLLLTQAEYSFWRVLKNKTDEYGMLICPKVRMEDFVLVQESEFAEKQRYRGRIKSRHIDFLLCDSKLNILAGIELDDNTHKKDSVREVDEFKAKVFAAMGLPLYRVLMSNGYYEKQIEVILTELGVYKRENKETHILQDEWRLPLGKKNGEKGV